METSVNIVGLYKKSWENHDENLLRFIFHPEAVYYEKPFVKKPFQGIEEIIEYWKNNSEVQRNVKFTILREIHCNNEIIAEWRCEFDRIDLGKHLVTQGVFWANLKDNKINHFVEYFLQKE